MRFRLLTAIAVLALLCTSGTAGAASIKFNFDNGSASGSSNFGPAISSVSPWSMSNGSPTFINTGGSSTLFDFVWGKGWNGLGNDYTFSFTVTAGFTVTFTSLSFFDATIFGPTAWSLSIDGFGFGSGSTHGGIGGTNSTVLPSLVFAAGTHNVKLHAAGANLSSGLWAVDDFKLSGIPGIAAPVPLPAAVWLMGSALLGLAGMGRRRACGQTPLS